MRVRSLSLTSWTFAEWPLFASHSIVCAVSIAKMSHQAKSLGSVVVICIFNIFTGSHDTHSQTENIFVLAAFFCPYCARQCNLTAMVRLFGNRLLRTCFFSSSIFFFFRFFRSHFPCHAAITIIITWNENILDRNQLCAHIVSLPGHSRRKKQTIQNICIYLCFRIPASSAASVLDSSKQQHQQPAKWIHLKLALKIKLWIHSFRVSIVAEGTARTNRI